MTREKKTNHVFIQTSSNTNYLVIKAESLSTSSKERQKNINFIRFLSLMRFIHSFKKADLCELKIDGSSLMGVIHKMKHKPDVAK